MKREKEKILSACNDVIEKVGIASGIWNARVFLFDVMWLLSGIVERLSAVLLGASR